jgi:hypothetical protein
LDLEDGENAPGTRATRLGHTLILAGFIPFAALAFWLYGIASDHPWRQGTIVLMTAYGAVILSFLGGIRWGIALTGRGGENQRDLVLGIVPPLVGWIAIMVPAPLSFVLLAVAFAAQGAWDSLTLTSGAAPNWFRRARIQMTIPVVAALVVAFVATSPRITPECDRSDAADGRKFVTKTGSLE